jgi:predicted ArsR family transcriptional regulator
MGDDGADESWWAALDAAVLTALAEARGRLTPREIADHVGISEDAARSVVSMLAERGQVRIAAVELPSRRLLAAVPLRPRRERKDRGRATP